MNVAFNYIKFATYSAAPFVVVLTLNVAVIWRTVRNSPNLRRSFGGQSVTTDRGHVTRRCMSRQTTTTSSGSGSGSWHQQSLTSLPASVPGATMTASQVIEIGEMKFSCFQLHLVKF